MWNREIDRVIGDKLQTLFHPIVNATKQAGEETKKELVHMKKTLTDIDRALAARHEHVAKPPPPLCKAVDNTYGFYKKDGQLNMGNKAVRFNAKRNI